MVKLKETYALFKKITQDLPSFQQFSEVSQINSKTLSDAILELDYVDVIGTECHIDYQHHKESSSFFKNLFDRFDELQ